MGGYRMKITILGAGNTGLAMAAHAVEQGHHVILWNRFKDEIESLLDTQTIHTLGEIEGAYKLDLVTTDIEEALNDPDIILIATPSFVHRYFAEEVAKYLKNETIILLCPGRTYGALEFIETFKRFNNKVRPVVAETQTAIYTCRKTSDDTVEILSIKSNVLFSALNAADNKTIYEKVPPYIQTQLNPAKSIVETSIGTVGMIMHCAPLLLNTGWTESKTQNYKYYLEGISPSIAKILEKIDEERIAVSKKLGYEVESVRKWLERVYDVKGETLYESIQNTVPYKTIEAPTSLDNRYITEDVPNGLVPLESTGHSLGLEMKYTGIIIELANILLNRDFRSEGRNLKKIFRDDQSKIDEFLKRSEVSE